MFPSEHDAQSVPTTQPITEGRIPCQRVWKPNIVAKRVVGVGETELRYEESMRLDKRALVLPRALVLL